MNQVNPDSQARIVIDLIPCDDGLVNIQTNFVNIAGGWPTVVDILLATIKSATQSAYQQIAEQQQQNAKPPLVYIPGFNGSN